MISEYSGPEMRLSALSSEQHLSISCFTASMSAFLSPKIINSKRDDALGIINGVGLWSAPSLA